MDPNATLKEIREIINGLPNSPTFQDDADRLAGLNEALDSWIMKGGLLPKDWAQAYDSEAFPQVSNLDQWERDCLVNLLYDKADEYAELIRKNNLATSIVCAIDEEQSRLKNLANKIATHQKEV